MSYLHITQASLGNSFGSIAVNTVIAATLKAVHFVGKSYVQIPAPTLTEAVLSGLTAGSGVVCLAFATQSNLYGQLNDKLHLNDNMVRKVRSIVVFALPFFLTLFGVPWLATRMGQETSYPACGVFAAIDLTLFATHVNWQF